MSVCTAIKLSNSQTIDDSFTETWPLWAMGEDGVSAHDLLLPATEREKNEERRCRIWAQEDEERDRKKQSCQDESKKISHDIYNNLTQTDGYYVSYQKPGKKFLVFCAFGQTLNENEVKDQVERMEKSGHYMVDR